MSGIYQSWQNIADKIIDGNEIARFINGYYLSTQLEEDYGIGYLRELKRNHPEFSDQINRLMVMPGIGAYITHWFLESGGAICR
jgi:hypothetical protein